MSSRWWLNVGLALVIVIMGLVVIFKPGMHKSPPIPPLTSLSMEAITHIRLQRPDQPEIDLEKSGDHWFMTAPRKARANGFRINELLHLAVAKIATHFSAPTAELGRYGLDKPRAELWLNDQKISFGGPHPLNPDFYILYNGSVYLVPEHFDNAATGRPSDFFSTRLINTADKPVAFSLPGLHLTRKPDGSWQVTPPNKDLSTDRVNQFVDEWRYAEALSVTPYSGRPVIDHIRITFVPRTAGSSENKPAPTAAAAGTAPGPKTLAAAPEELDLGILARKPELILYRHDEGLEYHFPAEMATQLLQLKPD